MRVVGIQVVSLQGLLRIDADRDTGVIVRGDLATFTLHGSSDAVPRS